VGACYMFWHGGCPTYPALGWDLCTCLSFCTCSLPAHPARSAALAACTSEYDSSVVSHSNSSSEQRHVWSAYPMVQANLEAAKFQLSDEDYEELSQLKHQQRSVPASGFLKDGGPYREEADVWEKGWPGSI
jgi:hypothetical protein